MKKIENTVIGLILIIIGVIIGLNAFHITNIDLFFDGWWTFFIIVPCFFGLFKDQDRTGNIIGLIVGIYLLLYCQGLINFQFAWKLVFPVIFVLIGLKMIFKDTFNKKKPRQNIYDNQLYIGGNYDVTFNGLILDLSKAYLNEETNITISTLFGGVDLYLPDDVNIQIQSSNFLGGVDLHKRENKIENTKVIYLNARCIFGGINIK
jgi:predicted membrane protein